MDLESLLYVPLGNNVVIGSHIQRQLEHLKVLLPPGFLGRRMHDLGCGDGRVTVLLDDIFRPAELRGFDVNSTLVRRARRRGVEAEVVDLECDMPRGELAVLWGVLHHLDDPLQCLLRVRENYDLVCLREPLRGGSLACFELGSPMTLGELQALVGDSLPGAQVVPSDDHLFVFYAAGYESRVDAVCCQVPDRVMHD